MFLTWGGSNFKKFRVFGSDTNVGVGSTQDDMITVAVNMGSRWEHWLFAKFGRMHYIPICLVILLSPWH